MISSFLAGAEMTMSCKFQSIEQIDWSSQSLARLFDSLLNWVSSLVTVAAFQQSQESSFACPHWGGQKGERSFVVSVHQSRRCLSSVNTYKAACEKSRKIFMTHQVPLLSSGGYNSQWLFRAYSMGSGRSAGMQRLYFFLRATRWTVISYIPTSRVYYQVIYRLHPKLYHNL